MSEWMPKVNMEKLKNKEYRYKIFRMDARDVMRLLYQKWTDPGVQIIELYKFNDVLPDDVEVIAISLDSMSFHPPCFRLLMTHPSFPVAIEGENLPEIRILEVKMVELKRTYDMCGHEVYKVPPPDHTI